MKNKEIAIIQESAMDKQVAGSHYTSMVIQPVEYCHKNGLGFCESAAVKYVSRWRAKGGIEDLKKAIHMIELLIEMEGGSEQQQVKIIPHNPLTDAKKAEFIQKAVNFNQIKEKYPLAEWD